MSKFRYNEYLSQFRNANVCTVNALATSCPSNLVKENKDGWICLHYSAYYGEAECLKTLLKVHPNSVDKRTLQEQTALLLAVSCEHLSCARCLLESGADPDISNKYKETPLFRACELENIDMVNLLLSHGATVNQRCSQTRTALLEAVSRNHIKICEMLIDAGAFINPPNSYSIAPLIVAAQQGHLRALSFLITKGADVNMQTCDGLTALHKACTNGHREIVAMLLSKNADANKCCNSGLLPLHVAAQYGHHEMVSLLVPVTSRARLRHSWISPLHLAAQHNRPLVAAALLQTGAEVNAPLPHAHSAQFADHRATALYLAVAHGSTQTAEVLLKAGARVDLDPVSPLLVAVKQGCVRTVNLLLHQGADVNAKIPCHATTFPTAIGLCVNNLPLLKCLLDNGCNTRSCFTCIYGPKPHPDATNTCSEPHERPIQFCEWLASSIMCKWAGPMIDLLLEHVGQVQLCSKLTELLDSTEEWRAVKGKSMSPRSLLHLCRVKIRSQIGGRTLRSLTSLPLPDRMLSYLTVHVQPSPHDHMNNKNKGYI
uniref:Ankyrin repeat and SOCS box containing 2b n=1 Tax=Neogobius melanostomus TaxID=47308 RepID=A0A8C6SYC6_9GOBI